MKTMYLNTESSLTMDQMSGPALSGPGLVDPLPHDNKLTLSVDESPVPHLKARPDDVIGPATIEAIEETKHVPATTEDDLDLKEFLMN